MNWQNDLTLKAISANAQKSRRVFFEDIGDFPEPCRTAIKRNCKNRLDAVKGAPLLGECAPWMISDLLGGRAISKPDDILPVWMNLYMQTMMLDEIIDTPTQKLDPQVLIASSLLGQRGLKHFFDRYPTDTWVSVQLDKCVFEMADMAIDELHQHRMTAGAYTDSDVINIGKKFSILKLCAVMLIEDEGDVSSVDRLLLPVSMLASGMQLLDDITDWKEDWDIKNYSPLLTATVEYIRKYSPRLQDDDIDISYEGVLFAMVLSESLEGYLEKASCFFEHMFEMSTCDSESATAYFFKMLQSEVREFVGFVKSIRKSIEGDSKYMTVIGDPSFQLPQHCKTALRDVERALEVVAQGC